MTDFVDTDALRMSAEKFRDGWELWSVVEADAYADSATAAADEIDALRARAERAEAAIAEVRAQTAHDVLADLRAELSPSVFAYAGLPVWSDIPEFVLRQIEADYAQASQPASEIVCICGSTRFRDEMTDANRRLTLAGRIVVAPGVFAHSGDAMTDEQKVALDALHFRKIDLAQSIYVVNPGGYIGESTAREIAYAEHTGKPVTYLVEPASEVEQ